MSLEIKKRGDTWTYVVDVGINPLSGKRKRKSKGGFRTKGECRAAASKVITKVENGTFFEASDISIEDFFKKYFETIKQNLAPKTFDTYQYLYNSHIYLRIGRMKLKKLKPIHIQDVYNEVLKSNSSTTVRHVHDFLHKSLKVAVKWKLIIDNPCDDVEKPKRAEVDICVLNENQLNLLLKSLEKYTLYDISLTAAATGMREAEICGLIWENVDLENKIIYVRCQLQKVDGVLKLVPPKTSNSRRSIQLPNNLVVILKNVKDMQQENKDFFKDGYDSRDFVFAKADGRPYDPGYVSRNFNRVTREYKNKYKQENGEVKELSIVEKLNIPQIRFHDIRHTHATLLLKAGISIKVVAERLGDTVNTVLHTYAHVLPGMQKEAAEKLNDIFT